jgi:hypothetical protein
LIPLPKIHHKQSDKDTNFNNANNIEIANERGSKGKTLKDIPFLDTCHLIIENIRVV